MPVKSYVLSLPGLATHCGLTIPPPLLTPPLISRSNLKKITTAQSKNNSNLDHEAYWSSNSHLCYYAWPNKCLLVGLCHLISARLMTTIIMETS